MTNVNQFITRTFSCLCLLTVIVAQTFFAQTLQLDPTFGSNGKLTLDFTESGLRSSYAHHVFTQSSGRIVVYGRHITGGQLGIGGTAACGLTQSGALDINFGTGGRTLEMNGSEVRAISHLPNGQFLRLFNVFSQSVSVQLQRLNSSGSVDGSFLADLNIGSAASAVAMATRSDGKFLVVLADVGPERSTWLFRLNPNGSRDTSFGTNGVSVLNLRRLARSSIAGVHVLPDNRILLGGYASTLAGPLGGNIAWAALLDENGRYDRRFGRQGIVRHVFPHGIRVAKTVLQPDGKLLLIGHAGIQTNERLMMVRLTTRGRLDVSLGNGGIAIAPGLGPGNFDIGHSAALMSDGRIVIVGSHGPDQFGPTSFLVARFSSAGMLESHSITPFTPDYNSVAYGVSIQPDGKVLVAGHTRNPDTSADGELFAIARYTQ